LAVDLLQKLRRVDALPWLITKIVWKRAYWASELIDEIIIDGSSGTSNTEVHHQVRPVPRADQPVGLRDFNVYLARVAAPNASIDFDKRLGSHQDGPGGPTQSE
jgi:hypothetical protein